MLYNVAQLLKEGVGASRRYAVDETVEYPGEHWGVLHPTGGVSLLRTHWGILVQGTARVTLTEECGRCLTGYSQELEAEIEEEFLPVIDVVTGSPLATPNGEEAFFINEHHLLDITEVLRQAIVVARPLQPLCREQCAGLCPECGQDRNVARCRCEGENGDPRWARLKELLV